MKLWQNKKRVAFIAVAAVVILSVTTSAMVIDNFPDYNPPTTLRFDWGDYLRNDNQSQITSNNATSDYPRWSAAYPYRTIFYGAQYDSTVMQKHMPFTVIVYSKNPSTDLFTFEYREGERKTSTDTKRGYIRAYINKDKYGIDKDIQIVYAMSTSGIYAGTQELGQLSYYSTYTTVGHTVGNNLFFDFDFYYECASEHQQNASALNINGLGSVSGVPYAYILECDSHGTSGGSSSGGSSSGGSSSGGSGGSGGSGSSNSSGDDGRHGWGSGEYGGGVDRDDLNSGNADLDVPDDWKEPVEDNYNGGNSSEYVPDFPAYVPSEGDTGNNGSSWELPAFDFDNDGVSGEINGYKDLQPDGEYGLIELLPGIDDWGYKELIPEGEQGLIDFLAPFK